MHDAHLLLCLFTVTLASQTLANVSFIQLTLTLYGSSSELTANQQISIDKLELIINTQMLSPGSPHIFHAHILPIFS